MISITTRVSKFTELKPYDYFSKPDDFIEVCEWANGEGFDVTIQTSASEQRFSVTWGQWEAIQALVVYKE